MSGALRAQAGPGQVLAGVALATVVAGRTMLDVQTVRGSGRPVTSEHDLSGFDSLEIRRGYDVRVVPADGFAVLVTTDDDTTDHLRIEVIGRTLRFDIDEAVNLEDATVTAEVALPSVRRMMLHGGAFVDIRGWGLDGTLELDLSGGSDASCSDLVVGSLRLDLSGGSGMACTDLDLDTLKASLDGGSDLRLTGASVTADIVGSGASRLDLADLTVAGADVRLEGGSEASLEVGGVLETELTDGAALRYRGDPVIGRTDISDGATLARLP